MVVSTHRPHKTTQTMYYSTSFFSLKSKRVPNNCYKTETNIQLHIITFKFKLKKYIYKI